MGDTTDKNTAAVHDRRLTPVRDDLVGEPFQDQFPDLPAATGISMVCAASVSALMKAPSLTAGRETELLFGEPFTVYEQHSGWAWGQSGLDGYVGYVAGGDLVPFDAPTTHRINVLRTLIFSAPDIKSVPFGFVSMNALLRVTGEADGTPQFLTIALPGNKQGYVIADHCCGANDKHQDYVSLAAYYLHAPYLWGGRSSLGLDCSALVQNALTCARGIFPGEPPILRDTDMQETSIGENVEGEPKDAMRGDRLKRGDLIFWKGHVAIMCDETNILHANATHMAVSIDPLDDFAARVLTTTGPVTSIKRP
ncbi:MAG: NlpC/P60 family protein [Pseudomonadota bacterium]